MSSVQGKRVLDPEKSIKNLTCPFKLLANDDVVDDEEAAAFRLILVDKNDASCDDGDLLKCSICLLIGVDNDKN